MSDDHNEGYQNRPSLISDWQQTFSIFQNGTFADSDGILRMNTLPVSILFMLVHRAYRLRRCSLIISHTTGSVVTATLEIVKGVPAGQCVPDSFDTTSFEFEPGIPQNSRACYCIVLSHTFERCEVWAPRLTFSPSIVDPRAHLTFDTELR